MINVANKFSTHRYARAEGILLASPETIERVQKRTVPKGDVLQLARAAGISAAKKTADWIVFCHPIPLDWVEISYEVEQNQIKIKAEVESVWKTGVEMEALTAVSAALLNAYDMLKPLDENLSIGYIRLIEKRGGKTDFREKFDKKLTAAVLVISDSTYQGKREDKSGKLIQEFLASQPVEIKCYEVLPDEAQQISDRLTELIDRENVDIIFTTGGTGIGPRDVTPEATRNMINREVPGIAEAMRSYGKQRTPFAMLSRSVVGVRKNSLVVNLPGSSRGVQECLNALFPGLLHAFPMLWGEGHENHHKHRGDV